MWNVEDGFSIHLPPSVRQARHELVQLSDKVVLDASNDNNRQTASNLKAITQGHNNHFSNKQQLECGPMPNLMVALPNIGGALCSTPQSLADAHY